MHTRWPPRLRHKGTKLLEGPQTQTELLDGIARGEKAIEDGRVLSQAQAEKRMARWLKQLSRNLL
jgi:hypothetical protein